MDTSDQALVLLQADMCWYCEGAAIGLNAAFLNIITEWLSDIKLGHCTTAFYLNESFCCWGAEDGKTPLVYFGK
jgi:chloride channel 3/4/5